MAEYSKKKIQETEDSGFGKYEENTGGGTPMGQGGKYAKGGRGVWKDEYDKKPKRDEGQPRTSDGKFTYNSVNGKGLKYESRGKTVNPLLTGGENGIMIDDVEKGFSKQSGAYWDKYKDSWYTKGGEIVTTDLKTRIAAETIWNLAKKKYDTVKGEFQGESHVFDETKKGRPGKEEAAAKQKVEATGEEQPVISQKTGGIKLKPGSVFVPSKPVGETPKPKAPAPQPAAPIAPTPVIPAQPTEPAPQPEATTAPAPTTPAEPVKFGSGKYTSEQAKAVRDQIKAEYAKAGEEYDPIFDNDEFLEQFIDSQGGASLFAEPTNENDANEEDTIEKEEDSEKIKKIKAMGFDGED